MEKEKAKFKPPKARCQKCGEMAPLLYGRCVKCRTKDQKVGRRVVVHGLVLRESRTPIPKPFRKTGIIRIPSSFKLKPGQEWYE